MPIVNDGQTITPNAEVILTTRATLSAEMRRQCELANLYNVKTQMALVQCRWRMNEWRNDPMSIVPSGYEQLHLERAKNDIVRMLDAANCGFAGQGTLKEAFTHMRVTRVFGDDLTSGALRDFRWSDLCGGSWFEKLSSGGSRFIEQSPWGPGHL